MARRSPDVIAPAPPRLPDDLAAASIEPWEDILAAAGTFAAALGVSVLAE